MTEPTDSEDVFQRPGNLSVGRLVKFTVGRHGRFLTLASDGISQAFRLYGEWAQQEVELLAGFVRPGDTVLDIGANLGSLTVPLAKLVGPDGHVIAFEAQPAIHLLLCANLALNELLTVRALNVAVGDRDGFIELPKLDYTQPDNYGGVSFAHMPIGSEDGTTRIACRRLDDLLGDLPSCHLIKMDVEGMEAAVMSGGAAVIGRHRPVIYGEATSAYKAMLAFAQAHDYRAYWHGYRAFNPDNFFATSEDIYGPGGDVNLLLVPIEKNQPVGLLSAREADDVYQLLASMSAP